MKIAKYIVNLIAGMLSAIIGIVSVALGMECGSMNVGTFSSSMTYGGDAYTGMQNASADTANNVMALARIVRDGLGSVLLVIGLLCLLIGAVIVLKSVFSMIGVAMENKQKAAAFVPPVFTAPASVPTAEQEVPVQEEVPAVQE